MYINEIKQTNTVHNNINNSHKSNFQRQKAITTDWMSNFI